MLAMALALGFIAYTLMGPGGGAKRAQLEAELNRIQEENAKLKEENRRLAMQAKALEDRNDFIEKTIREELGLVRRDELVLTMPASKKRSADGGPGADVRAGRAADGGAGRAGRSDAGSPGGPAKR